MLRQECRRTALAVHNGRCGLSAGGSAYSLCHFRFDVEQCMARGAWGKAWTDEMSGCALSSSTGPCHQVDIGSGESEELVPGVVHGVTAGSLL